jgi:GDPmannose 4,6-dehydratase
MMLQQDVPRDLVLGTAQSHSVDEFVGAAFACAGIPRDGRVGHDPRYLRPLEVESLRADWTTTREVLGWAPTVSFAALVERMVGHDVALARRETP